MLNTISIKLKCWIRIRIRIETNADRKHWIKSETAPGLTQHGVHGREGDPLPQPFHDPDGHEEVDAGPGGPGGEEGEEGGD